MAKRLTDTLKWQKPWFAELPPQAKLAWLCLLDTCDHCGVWPENYKFLSFNIGFEVTEKEIMAWFGDKLTRLDDQKLLILPFIEFQYGKLNERNKAHSKPLELLNSLRTSQGATKPLPRTCQGHKDKDKDKAKVKDKGGLLRGKIRQVASSFDLESLYRAYPRKVGKSVGLSKLQNQIASDSDFVNFQQAVKNYSTHVQDHELRFVKHFSTFVSEWRDWVDYEPMPSERTWFHEFCESVFNDPGLANKAPRVIKAFTSRELFDEWSTGLAQSKAIANNPKLTDQERKRYFEAALEKELKARGI